MRVPLLIGLAIGVAACGKSDEAQPAPPAATKPATPKPPSQPKGAANPQAQLNVTVDGKPVPMATALARPSRDAWELIVSSVPLGCDDLAGDGRMLYVGEVWFTALVKRALNPDGSFAWYVEQASFDADTVASTQEAKDLVESADRLKVAVKLEVNGMSLVSQPARKLAAAGAVDAIRCPAAKVDSPPPAPTLPSTAVMEIAGQKVPIVAAKISHGSFGQVIELSAAPLDCDHSWRSNATVTLNYKDGGADVWQADLTGEWFGVGQKATQIFDKGKLSATLAATPADAPVEVTLDGHTEIMKYPVALSGKVTAVRCAK